LAVKRFWTRSLQLYQKESQFTFSFLLPFFLFFLFNLFCGKGKSDLVMLLQADEGTGRYFFLCHLKVVEKAFHKLKIPVRS